MSFDMPRQIERGIITKHKFGCKSLSSSSSESTTHRNTKHISLPCLVFYTLQQLVHVTFKSQNKLAEFCTLLIAAYSTVRQINLFIYLDSKHMCLNFIHFNFSDWLFIRPFLFASTTSLTEQLVQLVDEHLPYNSLPNTNLLCTVLENSDL
jgi:hypothetical protein